MRWYLTTALAWCFTLYLIIHKVQPQYYACEHCASALTLQGAFQGTLNRQDEQ